MTAAEVENRNLLISGMEVVRLNVSDGETYVSKKFGTLTHAIATGNHDTNADLNVTISSGTATVNWQGVSDKDLTLVLFGRK